MNKLLSEFLGILILPAYLIATILIGRACNRRRPKANDFLNASRSLPLWVVVASFLSANCGAVDIIGLSALAAQYGVQAFHFYWIGSIPGMVFLAGVMIPIYMRSEVRSLPEYLEKRFDARMRLINSWLILGMVTTFSGIGLYAMAQALYVVLGWPFFSSTLLAATIVLIYVLLGGLRATIYNEVFQLLVIILSLLPLLLFTTTAFHGSSNLSGSHWRLWASLPAVSHTAILDRFGVIAGLGFVLGFGYWCTDFVMIQRVLTARTIRMGRLVPLLAGFGKLGFSLLLTVPALGAATFLGRRMPASFDQTLPALMAASYGPALLGLGMTGLLASLMAGLAANVSAFSAIWTEEIYRRNIRPGEVEEHYIHIGRVSVVAAVALSLTTSYMPFYFHSLMEYVQMIVSLVGAPFFAVFLIGIFTRRATSRGAAIGLCSGIFLALVHHAMVAVRWLVYGSLMSANFYVAVYSFLASLGMGLLFSRKTERKSDLQLERLVYWGRHPGDPAQVSAVWWLLAFLLLAACVMLNYVWR